jgi:hypothetical protein
MVQALSIRQSSVRERQNPVDQRSLSPRNTRTPAIVVATLTIFAMGAALSVEPPWAAMWLISLLVFAFVKWMSWSASGIRAPVARQLAYLFAWPGLDAVTFLTSDVDKLQRPTSAEWQFAFAKLVAGCCLLFIVAGALAPSLPNVAGWVGMAGIVFVLHFGSFHLLSCLWRSRGIDAKPLMNYPAASRSVTEFWGRRWNTAFRDITHRFVFRPFCRRLGPRLGLAAGFLFSGVVHDAVISLPAGGGYGLPTIYFLLQGAAVLLERSSLGRSFGLREGAAGRIFAIVVIVCPAPILFHPWFIQTVVLPFLSALGAIG